MYKKYTDEELFYIYNKYVNNHKTTAQIAKFIDRGHSGVKAALKRMGVDVSKISARNASYKLFKYMYNDISDETMICKRKYTIFSNYYE